MLAQLLLLMQQQIDEDELAQRALVPSGAGSSESGSTAHVAYWLSVSSTLLALVQRQLASRMASFAASTEGVRAGPAPLAVAGELQVNIREGIP